MLFIKFTFVRINCFTYSKIIVRKDWTMNVYTTQTRLIKNAQKMFEPTNAWLVILYLPLGTLKPAWVSFPRDAPLPPTINNKYNKENVS